MSNQITNMIQQGKTTIQLNQILIHHDRPNIDGGDVYEVGWWLGRYVDDVYLLSAYLGIDNIY